MENLKKYSNFQTVNKKANKLYNRDVFLSTRKDKKYMIMNDNNKWVHYETFRRTKKRNLFKESN